MWNLGLWLKLISVTLLVVWAAPTLACCWICRRSDGPRNSMLLSTGNALLCVLVAYCVFALAGLVSSAVGSVTGPLVGALVVLLALCGAVAGCTAITKALTHTTLPRAIIFSILCTIGMVLCVFFFGSMLIGLVRSQVA